MNFVSFEFAAFLAVVYALHWSCRYAGTRKWLLTIASYVFYVVWNWRFCFLMLFVTMKLRPRRTGGSAEARLLLH
jgi:alginate O-acetyltransferase complex protein AlgI